MPFLYKLEVVKIKNLSRQDRNGTRTSEELRRRYQFQDINYTKEEIARMKAELIVDEHLSNESTNPVQNRTVTQALNNKVNKENGKDLSSNDFTDEYKQKVDSATSNKHTHENKSLLDSYTQTEDNIADAVNKKHTHENINLLDSYTQTDTNLADAVKKKHSHSNKEILDSYSKTQEEILQGSHSHSNKTVLDGITSDIINRWNNVALYENGGTTDANTTIEELILTKVNAPTTDFWYIQTLFYSSKSTSSNRKQIAYSYKFDAPIYTRYYISGVWSEWTTGELKSSSVSNYEGYMWFKNGMLLQWGQVSIKPTAANAVTSTSITFKQAYDFPPFITASPQVAYPADVNTSIGGGATDGESKTGMKIYMTRTNTSETNFRWFAIGYKSA